MPAGVSPAGINASYSFWLSFHFLAFFSGGSL